MNKKYYNNNNEKSLQRLINHIEGTYQSRKDVCLSLCKLINTTLNAQTYVMTDDVNLNTFIGFEDKSSIMVFQNAQGDFGIPDKTLEFSQAHQFYFVIKYLCTKLYNIDSENCQKVFVGNDLGNYVDIEHIK